MRSEHFYAERKEASCIMNISIYFVPMVVGLGIDSKEEEKKRKVVGWCYVTLFYEKNGCAWGT